MTDARKDRPPIETSSPTCSMHEEDDVYMGYAAKEEVVGILNELLEAERAGARVTAESIHDAGIGAIRDVLRTIEGDEARWCAVPSGHLKALGKTPSSNIGAFYDKAMAIPALRERMVFLNRGQYWVVRKLRETLPRGRDDRLHRDLTEMLCSHETNIALTDGNLST